MSNKRGVSPLIATVLLIGFTVATVALVIMWGKGYTQETAEKEGALAEAKLSCENIDFTATSASWNGVQLKLGIKNKGTTSLDTFVFRINNGEAVVESASIVEAMSTKKISISDAGLTMGTISSVEIIPKKMVARGVYVPCSTKSKNVIKVQNA
ncbi:MAG: archaellin/type IV pilin N-terminal domain-containing protein [Nanoarchaeota archaeon]|nr:archaellin/type IV pilin N-terminal domain-containing protein [Nanoarchaeota archaeon]